MTEINPPEGTVEALLAEPGHREVLVSGFRCRSPIFAHSRITWIAVGIGLDRALLSDVFIDIGVDGVAVTIILLVPPVASTSIPDVPAPQALPVWAPNGLMNPAFAGDYDCAVPLSGPSDLRGPSDWIYSPAYCT